MILHDFNYFKTREEILKAVADQLAREINDRILPVLKPLADPAERICASLLCFIGMAAADKTRGWILVHMTRWEAPSDIEDEERRFRARAAGCHLVVCGPLLIGEIEVAVIRHAFEHGRDTGAAHPCSQESGSSILLASSTSAMLWLAGMVR